VCGLRQIAVPWATCILCTGVAKVRPLPLLNSIVHGVLGQEELFKSVRYCTKNFYPSQCSGYEDWRRSHREGVYPWYIHRIQRLEPADMGSRLEFCHWISAKPIRFVIFYLPTKRILPATESTVPDTPVLESIIHTEQSNVNTSITS
jgi:hypothetical protein